MKRPMKKRALALVLALGMAAALSSPALAAGGDAPGASVTGEPYYGTDYVQFEIRGADDMFYDVLYNGAKIYQHVSYTDPDYDGVNPVAIELEDGQDPAGYSLVVYEGRTAKPENTVASARIAGIYAMPEGGSRTWIGSVAVPEGTAPDLTALAATFVDPTGDYDLAPGTASVPLEKRQLRDPLYPLHGAFAGRPHHLCGQHRLYPDPAGGGLHGLYGRPGRGERHAGAARLVYGGERRGQDPDLLSRCAGHGRLQRPGRLCCALPRLPHGGAVSTSRIHLVADGEDGAAAIHTDTIDLTDTAFYYIAPQSFVNTSNGVTTLYEVRPGQETTLTLIPGEAAEEYTIHYLPHDPATAIDWHLILVDGTTNTRIGAQTVPVEPGETVEFDAAAHAPAGYAPTQDSYSYTYGGDNLVQYVYYTPAGYVPSESYRQPALCQHCGQRRAAERIGHGRPRRGHHHLLPGRFQRQWPDLCPPGRPERQLPPQLLQPQAYLYDLLPQHQRCAVRQHRHHQHRGRHDRARGGRRDPNRRSRAVPGGAAGRTGAAGGAGGGAYATGPAAGTGVTGITDETTGLNEMLNEEGQTLNEEREEQIAEGETPLAEAPGETPTAPEEETIEENAAAKAGIRTGLMIGGTVAALGMAAVLAVLIVTQRKRNRAERR